jgi:hypothetical protein
MRISNNVAKVWVCAAAILFSAGIAAAQMGGMMGGGGASAMRGIWNPTVGAGAEYQMVSTNPRGGGPQTQDMTIAVVGKEDYNGAPAYWLEITSKDPRSGGDFYMKMLIVINGANTQPVKMIMQVPGQPPMEMPMQMMANRAKPQPADVSKEGKDLGSETVTVPAGTFTCEHYQSADGGDVWVSTKISPWGMVKMNSKDTTMVLEKVVTDAKDMITGTPQQMPNFGGMGGPPQH